eukprot:361682_1
MWLTKAKIIVLYYCALSICFAEWLQQSSEIPHGGFTLIGTFNSTIVLLGGISWDFTTRQTIYDLRNDQFTYAESAYIGSPPTWGSSAQVNNSIVFLSSSRLGPYTGIYLNFYSMETKTYSFDQIKISAAVGTQACVAASNDYIFVLGGCAKESHAVHYFCADYPNRKYQAMHIETKYWRIHYGGMTEARAQLQCVYVPESDKLFAMGGVNEFEFIQTIEYTVVGDVYNDGIYPMHAISAQLPPNLHRHAVVSVNGLIWVIGGVMQDTVFIIDPQTETITLADERLPYSLHSASVIKYGNEVMIFGGYHDGLWKTTLIKYQLPMPTAMPTSMPPVSSPTPMPTCAQTNKDNTIFYDNMQSSNPLATWTWETIFAGGNGIYAPSFCGVNDNSWCTWIETGSSLRKTVSIIGYHNFTITYGITPAYSTCVVDYQFDTDSLWTVLYSGRVESYDLILTENHHFSSPDTATSFTIRFASYGTANGRSPLLIDTVHIYGDICAPTESPTSLTYNPTPAPTNYPTSTPTPAPTNNPIASPTNNPTIPPTDNPTPSPT